VTRKRLLEGEATPIMDALEAYLARNPVRLHVPGHSGHAPLPRVRRLLGQTYRLDLTEVDGLDDLAWPSGVIRTSEALAAQSYGASDAAFTTAGSSAALMAAIFAHVRPGDRVALPRASHRSVYQGVALAGAEPVYLPTSVDSELGYAVDWAVPDHAPNPPVRVAVVPYPTYPGVALPLRPSWLAEAVVIADAAHGGWLGLDPRLPPPPLAAGADLAVVGRHKSGVALTPGSLILWREGKVNGTAVRRALRLFQSTSPSYPVLASLEADRLWRQTRGPAQAAVLVDLWFEVAQTLGTQVWSPRRVPLDRTRLVLRPPRRWTGWRIARHLAQHGIEVEHADRHAVWLVMGAGLSPRDRERLLAILRQLPHDPPGRPRILPAPLPRPMTPLAEAVHGGPCQWQSLRQSLGRIAADWIVPYPPGTPVVVPGELVDRSVVDYLERCLRDGRHVHGLSQEGKLLVFREGSGRPAGGGRPT
jgi:arginine/lysine/ornithine decarboxylase